MIIRKLEHDNYIVDALNYDGICVLPTETVYGVCCKYNSTIGYEKIMILKNRTIEKTLPIAVGNYRQIRKICTLSEFQKKCVKKLLPGKITLVLPAKQIPEYLVKNGTIAIRFSEDKWLSKLICKLKSPICLTSANISGELPFKTVQDASRVFMDCVDVYVDGEVVNGVASTIVDLTNDEIKILREGPISKQEILERIK